jgi:hypothetical protein
MALYARQQLVKAGYLSGVHAFQTAKNPDMGGVIPRWTPNATGAEGSRPHLDPLLLPVDIHRWRRAGEVSQGQIGDLD